MTKKKEMAEWILDFFRRAKAEAEADHIVTMRSVQNKLIELTPKERDLFVSVANELIEYGYFIYEENTPQRLRLTQKGRDYINNPGAELDCCNDDNNLTGAQSKYMEQWHNSFVNFINGLLAMMESLLMLPNLSEEDKRGLTLCKSILNGVDVRHIEKSLAEAKVSRELLERIEYLYKRLVDTAITHIETDALLKEFLKRLSYIKIEQDKQGALMRLSALKIPVE